MKPRKRYVRPISLDHSLSPQAAITNVFGRQAGYYDGYVPAAGPSRSVLADTTSALSKRRTGMENSMHAPKKQSIILNPAARPYRAVLANPTNSLPKRKTGLETSMHAPNNFKLCPSSRTEPTHC